MRALPGCVIFGLSFVAVIPQDDGSVLVRPQSPKNCTGRFSADGYGLDGVYAANRLATASCDVHLDALIFGLSPSPCQTRVKLNRVFFLR